MHCDHSMHHHCSYLCYHADLYFVHFRIYLVAIITAIIVKRSEKHEIRFKFHEKKTNQFWEAYFQALELLDSDRGKRIEEVPVVREIPIDENYIFRIGRIRSVWELIYLPTGSEISVDEMDDCTRAMELLKTYIDDIVYLYEENS